LKQSHQQHYDKCRTTYGRQVSGNKNKHNRHNILSISKERTFSKLFCYL